MNFAQRKKLVFDLIKESPSSLNDLMIKTGLSKPHLSKFVSEMRKNKMIYIKSFDGIRSVFSVGDNEDAVFPKKERNVKKSKPKFPTSVRPATPFDALYR